MHVPDSRRQAHVHRLKEFAWVALLLDGLQSLQACNQVTEHTPPLQIDIL